MTTTGRVVVLAVVGLWLSGCNVNVNVGPGDGGSGGGSGSTGGGSSSGGGTGGGSGIALGCSASMACPSGQFCFNGVCAYGCQTNGNCAADQFCDTETDHLCHNKTVQSCSGAGSCLSTQECVSGFCSTPPPATQCDPNQVSSGNDGCDTKSICFAPQEQGASPKCHTFPACAQDKTCPVGTSGAVCNDGLIPNKARICLVGVCKTVEHCPASWACVKFTATDVLGLCSNKMTGAPCTKPSECLSNNCSIPAPGFPGFCG